MKKEADAPADVVDMSNWQKVDEYAREQLNLERDATKMKVLLRVQVKLSNIQNPIRIPIDSPTSLYLFRRLFETRMSLAEVQAIDSIAMTVEQKTIVAIAKASKPRKGKHKMQEKATRDLGIILYGEASAGKQQVEGEWDEECDYFMATNPVRPL